MVQYILKRLVQSVFVLVGVSSAVFGLMYTTGDPVALLLPPDASIQRIMEVRKLMGFDESLITQYFRFLGNTLTGSFPQSITYNQSPARLVLERLPATFLLGASAVFLACVVAIPLGLYAALRRNSWVSTLVMGTAIIGYSTPVYWEGLILILLFSVTLGWLPASGTGSLRHLILPALALGTQIAAIVARMVWATAVEILEEEYIRSARGKGVSDFTIMWRHVLRNAMLPVITVLGLEAAGTLGNAILTETIFAWPGMARLTVQAIFYRDYPLVQAGVFFMAVVFVLANLLVDIAYVYLDPRIRYK